MQLTQVPSKAGYTFEGWYADKDLTERILSVHMDRDKTVYARWTKEPVQPPADPPKPSEPSEPTNPTRPDESPKTGDPSMAGAWMIWSISLGLGLVLCSQRRKHSK